MPDYCSKVATNQINSKFESAGTVPSAAVPRVADNVPGAAIHNAAKPGVSPALQRWSQGGGHGQHGHLPLSSTKILKPHKEIRTTKMSRTKILFDCRNFGL